MIEPKIFYRKLDAVIASIGTLEAGEGLLRQIIENIEVVFAIDLRIINGCLMKLNETVYEQVYPSEPKKHPKRLELSSPAVQAIVKSKMYIFDNPAFPLWSPSRGDRYSVPVAVAVGGLENAWVFIFELTHGWVREEIEFCFNAIRRALDYRLHSSFVESGLHQAAKIQQSLLSSEPPSIPGFDISVFSQPAELVGGDLYDFYTFDSHEFGICIGDASGHGLPAALMARDVVTGLRMGVEKHMRMGHTLKKLNEVILKGSYATSFISLFFAEVEAKGNLFYMNAGHPHPVLIHNNETQYLQTTGLILGAFPKLELNRSFVIMKPGSILVLYSDGIVERKNLKGEFYGIDRMLKVVRKNRNATASGIVKSIFESAQKFGNSPQWEDDATVMILKRFPD